MENVEKKQTKYDIKMERRRQQELKQKKQDKLIRIGGIAVAVLLLIGVAAAIIAPIYNKNKTMNETYISVGNHDITKFEYNYFFNNILGGYKSLYASFGASMGIDFDGDLSKQQYSEEQTWQEYLDQMTLDQIKRNKALADDADKNNFDYDDTADYKEFTDSLVASAEQAGVTVSEFYKQNFGNYATETNVEAFARESLRANAYYEELKAQNIPAEADVTAYYEENKKDYDLIDYRRFIFTADVAEDASEEEIATAMAGIKEKAEEMQSRLEAGEDFKALCVEYAPEEEKISYEGGEVDQSLSSDSSFAATPTVLQEWAFDESRTEGDISVAADEAGNRYYVAQFIERKFSETTNDTISDMMAGEKVEEIVTALMAGY